MALSHARRFSLEPLVARERHLAGANEYQPFSQFMKFLSWLIFVLAALLEVGGDAAIRRGLRGSGWLFILAGFVVLGSYGLVVNTVRWDFRGCSAFMSPSSLWSASCAAATSSANQLRHLPGSVFLS
jgi:hypothetical protein